MLYREPGYGLRCCVRPGQALLLGCPLRFPAVLDGNSCCMAGVQQQGGTAGAGTVPADGGREGEFSIMQRHYPKRPKAVFPFCLQEGGLYSSLNNL